MAEAVVSRIPQLKTLKKESLFCSGDPTSTANNINMCAYTKGTSAPSGAPSDGDVGNFYFDTTNKKCYFWDGSKWQLINSWQ